MQAEKKFVIVTGLSGAGKTQASKVLEDMGYFCVDNLPSPLISRFADLIVTSEGNINKVCLVVDLRDESFLDSIDEALDYLHAIGINYDIIFLEASDEVLVRRFKESRRSHPQSLPARFSRCHARSCRSRHTFPGSFSGLPRLPGCRQ